MKRILMILACCWALAAIPCTAYATEDEQPTRYATNSNATSENIKIQEIELSITCTKPNENISPENIKVDFKTEHCHVKEINVIRYNQAKITIASDDGYIFSNNIDEWTKISGNGIEIIRISRNYNPGGRTLSLDIKISNNASTEPEGTDSYQVLFDKYIDKIGNELQKIKDEGIKMSDANNVDSISQYIEKRIPKPLSDKIEIEVIVESKTSGAGRFLPAIAGTANNKKGRNGDCSFEVHIWEKDNKETYEKLRGFATIRATEYAASSGGSSGSSGGSSGGGGGSGSGSSGGSSRSSGSNSTNGLTINKINIIMGIWEPIDGKWKLKISDGSYANSQWATLDGKWYLLGVDGYMLSSWQMVNGKWYFLGQDGAMLTGWQLIDGKWYWMEESGQMITGWKQIGDKWYYLGTDGAMLAETTTPDGYTVNENGEWIQ